MTPFNSIHEGSNASDDVAGNICQATFSGARRRVTAHPNGAATVEVGALAQIAQNIIRHRFQLVPY